MRYAVINSLSQEVENIIEYDNGNWTPPAGTYIKASEECSIGDFWDETDQDYYRPLKLLKPQEDSQSIATRRAKFDSAKEKFKKSLFFVNLNGQLES